MTKQPTSRLAGMCSPVGCAGNVSESERFRIKINTILADDYLGSSPYLQHPPPIQVGPIWSHFGRPMLFHIWLLLLAGRMMVRCAQWADAWAMHPACSTSVRNALASNCPMPRSHNLGTSWDLCSTCTLKCSYSLFTRESASPQPANQTARQPTRWPTLNKTCPTNEGKQRGERRSVPQGAVP